MKKLTLSVVTFAVMFFAVSIAKTAIKTGNTTLIVTAGAADTKTGLNRSLGGSFGIQFVYQLNPNIGIGGDINIAPLGTANSSGPGYDIEDKAWVFTAMPMLKISTFGNNRPYLLVGSGFLRANRKIVYAPLSGYVWGDTLTNEQRTMIDKSAYGIAFMLGAGADFDINDRYFAGFQFRWTSGIIDKDVFEQYYTAMATFGVKFGK